MKEVRGNPEDGNMGENVVRAHCENLFPRKS